MNGSRLQKVVQCDRPSSVLCEILSTHVFLTIMCIAVLSVNSNMRFSGPLVARRWMIIATVACGICFYLLCTLVAI